MYRGVTGERRAWVDEVRSFVYIDNPGGSGTWYSWDADAHMSAERYTAFQEPDAADLSQHKHVTTENRFEKPDFNNRHAVTSRSFKNFYFQINPRPPVQKPRDRSGARTKIETPTRSISPKTYRYRKPTRKTRHHHTTHRRTTLLQISIFEKSRSRTVLQTHDRSAAATKTPRPGNHPKADPMEPRNTQSRRVTKNFRNRRFYSPQKPEKLLFDNLFA